MMPRTFPALVGFREVVQQPALVLGEISWRWSFAAAAWILVSFTGVEYLKSLPVTARDELLLRTGSPPLVASALRHIFRESAARLGQSVIVVGLAIAVLWISAATFGRLATLKSLLARSARRSGFVSLLGLNFLRAALFLAAMLASAGVVAIVGMAAPKNPEAAGAVGDLAFGFVALVWLLWAMLNWLLSFGSVVAMGREEDTFGAISAAFNLVRMRFVDVLGASAPFVALHYLVFVIAGYFVFFAFVLLTQIAPSLGFLVCLTALPYFAVVDGLYITRVAAYVALLDGNVSHSATTIEATSPMPTPCPVPSGD
jgi:hypothetical protein